MSRNPRPLAALAQAEVEATIRDLPPPVQARARELPVTCQPVPSAAMVQDGIDPDLLGLFVGESFTEEGLTSDPLPAQILLFLNNLWEEAGRDERRFREEVRTTYLHELGHYLGLGEEGLEIRGLE
jgi:predicted Zn-dependent protease with MMP-like domain